MADNPLQPGGKKELTMEQRLLLAFVLMGIVLFTTPYFFKTPPVPPGKKIQLGFQVGARTNGVDMPRWPENLLTEKVV